MFSPRSIGAFFLAALEALNIAASSSVYQTDAYQLVDYLADPYKITDTIPEFIFGDDRIETDSEFMERSTIKIDKDVVTIDGVPYTNVWLSTDAAEQFRTEGFDLKTAFNIANQSNGTFVESAGTVSGVPVYRKGNYNQSPFFTVPNENQIFSQGKYDFYYTDSHQETNIRTYFLRYMGGSWSQYPITTLETRPAAFQVKSSWYNTTPYTAMFGTYYPNDQVISGGVSQTVPNSDVVNTPVDFTWTAGEIPADTELPAGTGLNIQVPTSVINNFYITYPEYDLPNVDIPMVDVDPSLIDDLILPLIPVINTGDANIEFTEHETPTPPAPGTIANEPWESLRRALQDIKEAIQQGTTIQQTIKAGQDIITQLIAPINTTLSTINNSIGNLIDKIETGSIDFFRDTIRSIRVPFTRWFGLLAQNLGIWHYVVEWLQYISAPFSWFWNVFTNTNPILISPVYAMFAATLVIAIYRRFGR